MRLLFLAIGWLFVGIGVIGIFVPVLPTTPFILVAAGFFAKGSPRAEQWLVNHPVFGKTLADWRARGAIPRLAKILAVSMMSLSFLAIVLRGTLPVWGTGAIGLALASCAAYVLTRPDA